MCRHGNTLSIALYSQLILLKTYHIFLHTKDDEWDLQLQLLLQRCYVTYSVNLLNYGCYFSVCKITEWSQCYVSQGDCLKNRTVCSDVQFTNCTAQWSEWSDWSSCSYNSTGDCVQTRKRTGCGEEITDDVECQPSLCDSSE